MSRFAGLCALAIVISVSCGPASAANPKNILAESARAPVAGRSVAVLVSQSEIKSDIIPSGLTVAAGGGLLFALIDASIEADRLKKAEATIQPIRTALNGVDVDKPAQDTSRTVVEAVPWFQASEQTFSRDSSVVGKSGMLDASNASQVAFFEYVYDTAPDFSSVRVALTISLADKTVPVGKKPESRLEPKNLIYSASLTSVVRLPAPTADRNQNALNWSANDGKAVRAALDLAFKDLGKLAPQLLALTEADAKAMVTKDRKLLNSNYFLGRLQPGPTNEALLYNGGFVHIQSLTP